MTNRKGLPLPFLRKFIDVSCDIFESFPFYGKLFGLKGKGINDSVFFCVQKITL